MEQLSLTMSSNLPIAGMPIFLDAENKEELEYAVLDFMRCAATAVASLRDRGLWGISDYHWVPKFRSDLDPHHMGQ